MPAAAPPPTPKPAETPTLDAEQLLQGRSAVLINYRGQAYRLSLTRNGKLILTK